MTWKLEREDDYFKIFDENKNIAGYFDPEYGEIFPEHKVRQIIDDMHKNHEKIPGGYLMVAMVKFHMFDGDKEMELDYLQARLDEANQRILKWQKFLAEQKNPTHKIRVSHTDADMLSIAFPVSFPTPAPLENKLLLNALEPILNYLHQTGLL